VDAYKHYKPVTEYGRVDTQRHREPVTIGGQTGGYIQTLWAWASRFSLWAYWYPHLCSDNCRRNLKSFLIYIILKLCATGHVLVAADRYSEVTASVLCQLLTISTNSFHGFFSLSR